MARDEAAGHDARAQPPEDLRLPPWLVEELAAWVDDAAPDDAAGIDLDALFAIPDADVVSAAPTADSLSAAPAAGPEAAPAAGLQAAPTDAGQRATGRRPGTQPLFQADLPELADPRLPEPYVPAPTPSRPATARLTRRVGRVVRPAGLVVLALVLYGSVVHKGTDDSRRLRSTPAPSVRAPSTTAAPTTVTTLPPPPAPAPTTAAPQPTSAPAPPAPPPTTAAPRHQAPTPAPAPRRAPTTTIARNATGARRACGFAPGAPVDMSLNGRPAGSQTADATGCVHL